MNMVRILVTNTQGESLNGNAGQGECPVKSSYIESVAVTDSQDESVTLTIGHGKCDSYGRH